jgi:hypothetical protein
MFSAKERYRLITNPLDLGGRLFWFSEYFRPAGADTQDEDGYHIELFHFRQTSEQSTHETAPTQRTNYS